MQPDHGMQRKPARVALIRIRSKIKQHGCQIEIRVHHRHVQRRGAVRQRIVDVRAMCNRYLAVRSGCSARRTTAP